VKIILFSILVIFAIGLYALPQSFAVYPDPDKDPRDYLIRYYTEPDYKDWFDSQFPNTTVEEKVGYPNKIIIDDYYVNPTFDFVIKNPSTSYQLDERAQSSVEGSMGIVSTFFGGNADYSSGYIVWFAQNNPKEIPDDLIHWYGLYPEGSVPIEEDVSVQMKINNKTHENDGVRDIIRYEYAVSSYYPPDYWNELVQDKKLLTNNVIVVFLYPNGDEYEFIFDSPVDTYSKDVKEFDNILDSFFVGKVEKFSDMYEDYLGVQKSESVPEPTYVPEPQPEPEPTYAPSVRSTSGDELWFVEKIDYNVDMSIFDTPPETIEKIENMALGMMYNIRGYDTISESKLNYELNQISGIRTEITNFGKNSCETNVVTVKKDGTTYPAMKDLADFDHCLVDYSNFKNLQIGDIITIDQTFGVASLENISQDELNQLPDFKVTDSSTLAINGKKVDVVTAIAETDMGEGKMLFEIIIHKHTGIALGTIVKISSDGFLMEVEIAPTDISENFVSSPSVGYTPEPESVMCGEGTTYKDGQCVVEERGGGCLIATAAFGSEMAPQVQFLREIRDGTVMSTQSGTAFMTGFNQFYYSFSPAVADYERENPVFKEMVKVSLTPLLTSLTLLNYVEVDTEEEMLGYGIGIILLNVGMYFVAPAVLIISLKKRFL